MAKETGLLIDIEHQGAKQIAIPVIVVGGGFLIGGEANHPMVVLVVYIEEL